MADWRWVSAGGVDKLVNFDQLAVIDPSFTGKGACLIWPDSEILTIDAPTFKELQDELEKTSKGS